MGLEKHNKLLQLTQRPMFLFCASAALIVAQKSTTATAQLSKALYVLNKLFVAARTRSSKSHKDVRYFESGLIKLPTCSVTFRRYFDRKRLQ